MNLATKGRKSGESSSHNISQESVGTGKLLTTLIPQRRLSKSIASLKPGRNGKGRTASIGSDGEEMVRSDSDDTGGYDVAKSRFMMKSIADLLTTASVYAGMDDAQEADDLAQDLTQNDKDRRNEDDDLLGRQQKDSNDEVQADSEGGPVRLAATRKPTLFSFSVVPTEKMESAMGSDQAFKRKIIKKLLEHFKLDQNEELLKDYSAWLLKDVLVQGNLLVTSRHILFFAYLPKNPGTIKLSGNLNIRSTLRTSVRYWCILKDQTLSLYNSPTEVYFPVLTIDLSNTTSIHLEKRSSSDDPNTTFKVHNNGRTYIFNADTEYSARAWCNSLKKQQFAAQNTENDSVSVKIPLANIIDLDDQAIVKQALTVRIRALESAHSFAIDDFHFVFLDGSGFSLMDMVKKQLSALNTLGVRILFDNFSPGDDPNSLAKLEGGRKCIEDTKTQESSQTSFDMSSKEHASLIDNILHHTPGSLAAKDPEEKTWSRRLRSMSGSLFTKPSIFNGSDEDVVVEFYSRFPTQASDNASRSTLKDQFSDDDDKATESEHGHRKTKLTDLATKPFKNVAEMWNAHPIHYMNDYVPFSEDDPYLVKNKRKVHALHRFRRHFKLNNNEILISASFTHLVRNVPLYGKLYIANDVLCFRTLLPTVNTKMILPLNDVETCYKEKGFRFGYLGLVIVIRGHEELFLEFSTASARDDAEYVILKRLDDVKSKRRVPVSVSANIVETDSNTAKLKFFEDKINAEGFDVPLLFDENPYFKTNIKPQRSYKIAMLTIGSRGDVQPYIALGKGLLKEGHQVTIITHSEFREFVTKHGIGFEPIAGDPAELMSLMVEHESMNVGLFRDASVRFRDWITALLDTSWAACKKLGLDMLIESPSAMAGIHIAEALDIPYFRAFTMPWTRTRAYPHAFIVPDQKRGGNYNYLTHVLFENLFWKGISGQVNKWRLESLGLDKTNLDMLQQNKVPFFYNISPTIFPPSVDFSEWIKVTGYWFLDEKTDYKPPQPLVDFLSRARKLGKKLVYIGFGSIVVSNAKEMTKAIAKAVEDADVYCVLNKGWSERLNDSSSKEIEVELPECIFNAGNVPHDWLFPQMDAAVHHGGSGTTGATLRAGLPTVVKPFFGDQFFYALRVEDIGAGLALKKLNSHSLTKALQQVTTNKRMADRALLIKNQIANEDGVRTAINCIYGELEYARSLVLARSKKEKITPYKEVQTSEPLANKASNNQADESWFFV